MREITKVFQTSQYDKFTLIKGNREPDKAHLVRLADSMNRRYLMSPIIVNEKYQIIDGQHRLAVCEELGLPVNFIICKDYGLDEVKQMNQNSKNWTRIDYLNTYCAQGYDHYLRFKYFMQLYPGFGFRSYHAMLRLSAHGASHGSTGTVIPNKDGKEVRRNTFNDGDFEIVDWDKSCEIAEAVSKLREFYMGAKRSTFVVAIVAAFRNSEFDIEVFIEKLRQQPGTLVPCINAQQYLALFESIYNYKNRHKIVLRRL